MSKTNDRIEKYILQLLHNSALQPVMTFWMACCVVIPLMWAEWLNHWAGVGVLGFVAIMMVVLADRRDSRRESIVLAEKVDVVKNLVNGTSEAQERRIIQLTIIIEAHGIHVPDAPRKES